MNRPSIRRSVNGNNSLTLAALGDADRIDITGEGNRPAVDLGDLIADLMDVEDVQIV